MSGETIGERLRRLRQAAGLSQRDLSGPGVSYAYISRIEAGARTPSVKALRQLAPRLGVTVAFLETGRDELDETLLEIAAAATRLIRVADGTRCAEEAHLIAQGLHRLGYEVEDALTEGLS